MFAAVFIVDLSQLALCHRSAGRLDEAIRLQQQCVEINRHNLPSMRRELCTCE